MEFNGLKIPSVDLDIKIVPDSSPEITISLFGFVINDLIGYL